MKILRGIVVTLILASSAYLWAGNPAHAKAEGGYKGGGFVAEVDLKRQNKGDAAGVLDLQEPSYEVLFDLKTLRDQKILQV